MTQARKNKTPLTADRLRELIDYEPETGVFTWRARPDHRSFSSRRAGTECGTICPLGYRRIGVDGRLYPAGRLAWLHVHGKWPNVFIDHKDRQRDHDAIANLRECSPAQNARNSTIPKDNTSGLKGVRWNVMARKWTAQISHGGKLRALGTFVTKEEGHAAYLAAAKAAFGEFATDGTPAPRTRRACDLPRSYEVLHAFVAGREEYQTLLQSDGVTIATLSSKRRVAAVAKGESFKRRMSRTVKRLIDDHLATANLNREMRKAP